MLKNSNWNSRPLWATFWLNLPQVLNTSYKRVQWAVRLESTTSCQCWKFTINISQIATGRTFDTLATDDGGHDVIDGGPRNWNMLVKWSAGHFLLTLSNICDLIARIPLHMKWIVGKFEKAFLAYFWVILSKNKDFCYNSKRVHVWLNEENTTDIWLFLWLKFVPSIIGTLSCF